MLKKGWLYEKCFLQILSQNFDLSKLQLFWDDEVNTEDRFKMWNLAFILSKIREHSNSVIEFLNG